MFLKYCLNHGEKLQMWLNELKIAVVQKDTESLSKLLGNLPTLDDAKEIESAIYLLAQAMEIVKSRRDATADSMKQIQKNIKFLKSTQSPRKNKLDIKS